MIKKVLILAYQHNCYVEDDYFSAEERIRELEIGHYSYIVLNVTNATDAGLVEIGGDWAHFDLNEIEDLSEIYKDLVVDTSDLDEFYYWWYNK